MFSFKEIDEEIDFNPLTIAENAPFTQAWFFGEWQEMVGRKVLRFRVFENSETIGFFQIIRYRLIFSKNFLYIPHAPILKRGYWGQVDFLEEFHKKLFEISKEENAIFARFDFYSNDSDNGSKENFDKYFKKTPIYHYHSSYFQPKYEWILNIEKTEEELLHNMHPKTRYGIRLAESKGVKIEIIPTLSRTHDFIGVKTDFQKYFSDFYNLMKKTAERNKFGLHSKIYYENIFENCEKNKNAFLAIAKYGSKILAINLILLYGEVSYFVFGASSDDFKNLMAPHLLHLKTIIEVKKLGIKIYNFGAVDKGSFSALDGPASGWEGISRFKKRFGGELLEYSDSYDLVLKPVWYYLYNLRKKFL